MRQILHCSLSLSLHPSKIPCNNFLELFYLNIFSGHHSEHNFFHGSSITTEGENISKSCSLREVRAVMDIEADIIVPA